MIPPTLFTTKTTPVVTKKKEKITHKILAKKKKKHTKDRKRYVKEYVHCLQYLLPFRPHGKQQTYAHPFTLIHIKYVMIWIAKQLCV